MDISFSLIVQLIGWIGTFVTTIAFQAKNTLHMVLLQALAGIIFGIHYVLLGAHTAGLIQFIFAFNVFLLSSQTENWRTWRGWKWVVSGTVVVISLVTWNGFPSLIPCACSISGTLSNWSRNGKIIRMWRLFFISPMWILYDIIVHSWPGVVLELISMASVAVSIWRYGLKDLEVS